MKLLPACTCGDSACAGIGGGYYVSVKDGRKFGLLAGPYETHSEAIAKIRAARDIPCHRDPWAWFYHYGTVRMKGSYREPGKFGKL